MSRSTIKALSIKQPWADLIASGQKTIETRTWSTKYRGQLLIVSSAKPTGPRSGLALCTVRVTDCRPMTAEDETAAQCPLYPGAWAWILTDVRPIEYLIPLKGRLGIYEVSWPGGQPVASIQP